ncbi:hypothetical protein BOTBODRAFT_180230 [Botryobasidium botryosum FD-172 SS1]|uniref:DUF4140 domain-containing protein n=1 Tax=Botryobasidium botryosum (strain FD-172 SS1) TaxID=930990 RepID=A0A067M8T1_BOTB1|nr:hypothetical protein BOTBODRAFT_180230 [Botryobasidium botryosum FD-172 SS1]
MTKVSDIDAAFASTAVPDAQTNVVQLVSADVSTIANVSLCGSCAEITRVAKLDLKAGQNRVTIAGLPDVMLEKTLRVEGRGSAIIQDNEKRIIESSQYRISKRLEALESFPTTLSAKDNSIAQVTEVLAGYETEAAALQNQSHDLGRQPTELDRRIGEEENKLRTETVSRASWRAAYDTRVTTANTKDGSTPVDLIYKVLINKSRGESSRPPHPHSGSLSPNSPLHNLHVYHPQPAYRSIARKSTSFALRTSTPVAMAAYSPSSPPMGYDAIMDQEAMVTSWGNVTATFSIPGRSNILSDGEGHQVTIAKLKLGARLQWVAVPSMSLQTHLKANIKNASGYTFLPGETSVYLDGNFISNSPVPPVSPEKSFDCPSGVYSSIRLTYHPRTTRAIRPVENATVLAQVPVSQDAMITVKISKPALPPLAPGAGSGSAQPVLSDGSSGSGSRAGIMRVSPSVVAEWEDGQEERLKWTAKLASQEKLLLELEWEVSAPVGTSIVGL